MDALAQGIANCTKQTSTRDSLQVYNMVHPNPADWSLFHETLQTKFGISAEAIALRDWLVGIDQGDLKIHGFLSTQGKGRERSMSYENARALEVLPPIDPINIDLLARWLRGWGLESKAKL